MQLLNYTSYSAYPLPDLTTLSQKAVTVVYSFKTCLYFHMKTISYSLLIVSHEKVKLSARAHFLHNSEGNTLKLL